MAAVNLPDNPANGTTQTVGGITYTYNSSKGYWTAASSGGGGGGGGGGASVSTSDSAPSSPSDGDLWYDTDDGGMFVYYADGSSNQWVEVIGQAGATGATGAAGADGGAGTATVVANVTALMAISSPSAGDQAFVTATNTLYFYNGSGWYKIALINTTPSISGANASYNLATDGTATTVTLVASDPEGLPITYSIASDTSGNIATVAQGTGASTNVWTITPSTNTAHAGTFSLTFRASDGVNFATAVSSFTLQFAVQNSRYTTALITSVGANNATNTSFDDKSTSDHTITANGDSHQTTFSPYASGGYSYFFDGSGDYLEIDDGTWLTLGNGNFCFETWIYNTATTGGSQYIFGQGNSSGHANSISAEMYINSNRTLTGGIYVGSQKYATSTGTIPTNTWTHVALVRNGANIQLYINGTKDGENTSAGTDSANDQSTHFSIGRGGEYNGLYFTGHIADFRFVKGSSVHTGNFTSPTERLTAITNTQLLTCHLPYITDGSTNNQTVTVKGNTKATPFALFDDSEYAAADHGGSAHFDGTGDYLSIGASSNNESLSGDFCIEAWIYPTGTNDGTIIGNYLSGPNRGWSMRSYTSNNLYLYYQIDGGSQIVYTTATDSVNPNSWNHVVWCRSGTDTSVFVNGSRKDNRTLSGTSVGAGGVAIGSLSQGFVGYHFTGSISDARVVNGSAVYDPSQTTLTVPTAPLTAITNTKLLVQSTDAGIIDKAQEAKSVVLGGNAKSSTTQYKYLTSSMYFDGTGDYLAADIDGRFFTGPWTIEMWIWAPNYTGTKAIGPSFGGGSGSWNATNGHQWISYTYNGDLWFQYFGTNNSYNNINIGTVPLTNSTWCHWAYCWDGTTLRFFKDGTLEHSTTTFTPKDVATTNLNLGRHNNDSEYKEAYYSDVRITKGLARYTSNFTAPTAALKG